MTRTKIDQSAILRAFREKKKPLSFQEVLSALRLGKSDRRHVNYFLEQLVEDGRLIRVKSGYGLTESMRLVTGVFTVKRSGMGMVTPDDKRRKEIVIRPGDFGEAWNGDRVVAAVFPGAHAKVAARPLRTGSRGGPQTTRQEGRIARVLERKTDEMAARVMKKLGAQLYLCRPTDPRNPAHLMLDLKDSVLEGMPEDFGPGHVLRVALGERLDRELWAAEAKAWLGRETDLASQEALVKLNHSIPGAFPPAVLAEADKLPTVPSEADMAGRADLRDKLFVTIDSAKARDFDDAICVENAGRKKRLYVAIADVAHYVPIGSAMDMEARERGNSYYFPRSVEPMFPEKLSNGLCSLNPDVPRLTLVAEMLIDAKGGVSGEKFYRAVIHSKRRLTYTLVNKAVTLKEDAARDEVRNAPLGKDVLAMLERAEALARTLKAMRSARGSLDFDLPEPEILFNLHGEPIDIRPRLRQFSNQLIEEFMIAANEAVARHLTGLEAPCVYRSHPAPDKDKLATLFAVLSKTDLAPVLPRSPEDFSARTCQELLAEAERLDMGYLVNKMLLRSMMQAGYVAELDGHFGLASECYSHFTSPIRRYADLVTHRSLIAVLESGKQPMKPKGLKTLCEDLNATERKAVGAEREILRRATVLFLKDKAGETFSGRISAVTDFGFFVDLEEVMADGLVRLSSLSDDYYDFIPDRMELLGRRTGGRFYLGKRVMVLLADVDITRLETTLELAKEDAAPTYARKAEVTGAVKAKKGGAPKKKADKKAAPKAGKTTPKPAQEPKSAKPPKTEDAAKPRRTRKPKTTS